MRTPKIYGGAPKDLGRIQVDTSEMMYWLYCPIKKPRSEVVIPPNLKYFQSLVEKATFWAGHRMGHCWLHKAYVYITAKTMWVNGSTANRPGWHSDGFLTDDLNFIWMNSAPTIFCIDEPTDFVADHELSLAEMQEWADARPLKHVRYPVEHLLMLDQGVIHKVDDQMTPGVRTFVKISISGHPYLLKGNSINHELPLNVDYKKRTEVRNCPTGANNG